MSLFDGLLKDGESLFLDESTLDFDYLPDLLPYRENQQQYIADCLKPLARGRAGKSLLISGAPGIGKTSCVKFVFRELEAVTDKVRSVFINCWKKQTTNSILADLANQLGVVGAQSKSTEDLWEHIFRALARFEGVAIALDEIDKAKEYDFLYQLVENIKKCAILMITNKSGFMAQIDARIRSRLVVEELGFPLYKRNEIEGILEERKRVAFVQGVWSQEAFDIVVERCALNGDIRVGLVLMREAGRAAEHDASRRITVEHVMVSKANVVELRGDQLDERERRVLQMIKDNSGVETGRLADLLKNDGLELSGSTLRRILQKLDKGGYIFREGVQGSGGKTTKHYADE